MKSQSQQHSPYPKVHSAVITVQMDVSTGTRGTEIVMADSIAAIMAAITILVKDKDVFLL